MLRKTIYGVLVNDLGTPTKDESDLLCIIACAKSVGMEVIEGKTAISIGFCAEVMRRLCEREGQRYNEHLEQVAAAYGFEVIREECGQWHLKVKE